MGFLRVYDHAFGEVAQGGTRRGANMAVLRVDHPDVEEFITCKTNENSITNFNISVGITDAFMRAVENDDGMGPASSRTCTRPITASSTAPSSRPKPPASRSKSTGPSRRATCSTKIVQQAHHNGEPGMLFLDAANRSNPVPHLYQLEATNLACLAIRAALRPPSWDGKNSRLNK